MLQINRAVKILSKIPFLLLVVLLLLITPAVAKASLFDDFINEMNNKLQGGANRVKDLVTPEANNNVKDKVLSVESAIALSPDGDVNKNGQIDAGDILKFSYIITNPTTEAYELATLKTNIDTKKLNGVGKAVGIITIDLQNNTVTFPNLNIKPNQIRTISFESQVNFAKDLDQLISTEAELFSNSNAPILKSEKKEVTAKKMDTESFNKFVHITK